MYPLELSHDRPVPDNLLFNIGLFRKESLVSCAVRRAAGP